MEAWWSEEHSSDELSDAECAREDDRTTQSQQKTLWHNPSQERDSWESGNEHDSDSSSVASLKESTAGRHTYNPYSSSDEDDNNGEDEEDEEEKEEEDEEKMSDGSDSNSDSDDSCASDSHDAVSRIAAQQKALASGRPLDHTASVAAPASVRSNEGSAGVYREF
jgi:hypothetical protein